MTIRELHKKFVNLGNEHRKILYKIQAMIPMINRHGVWKFYSCASIFEYAAKYAGIGGETVKKALMVGEKVRGRPLLKRAVEAVGVNKVAVALRLDGSDREIAEKAMTMSKKSLELLAKEKSVGVAAEQKMSIELTPEMQKMFYILKKKFGTSSNRETFTLMMKELLETKKDNHQSLGTRKVETKDNSKKAQKTLKQIIKEERCKLSPSRNADTKNKKIMWKRSGGTCEYPGCVKVATHIHHPKTWMKEKSHDAIQNLCKEHHEIAHATGSKYADFEYRQRMKEIVCVT